MSAGEPVYQCTSGHTHRRAQWVASKLASTRHRSHRSAKVQHVTNAAEALAASETLDLDQRRLLTGICIVAGAISMVPSTYNFVLNPMLEGLGASESQEALLRQLPSIAALLVIFLAGSLGARIGERRLILFGSALFTFGCALVAVAPVLAVATLGLMFLSAASSAMAVVGLGLLSSRVTNPRARATAFASFALVTPIVYMAFPVWAGVLLDRTSWRVVAVVWTAGGLFLIWGVRTYFPSDDAHRQRAEVLSPALAGLALAATVQTISAISNHGLVSSAVAIRAVVAVGAALAFGWSYRRAAHPSISLAALKRGGLLVLLVVVIVVPFVNLWYYMTLGYQYVFGMTALQTAVLMVPAQLAGVAGALVARKLIQARGITFTGVALLLGLSVSLLFTLIIVPSTPVWLIVVIMSAYALASVGAGVPVTNSIMNTAPAGEEGSASAFRGAATHIGTALGVVVMSTIVFTAVAATIESTLGSEGLATTQSEEIATSMRNGASSEEVSAQYAVPVSEAETIDDAQITAMISGLHAHGLFGAGFIAAAAGIFWVARRGQSPPDA